MGGVTKILKFFKLKLREKGVVKRVVAVDREGEMDGRINGGVRLMYWEEIERLTKNFSTVIGNGGFSTVYLADRLTGDQSSGSAAAVKVQCSSERLNQVHKQELEILLHLNHPNIVKLFGYSYDREQSVLIFEYVSNGTLQEKLHGSTKQLRSWRRRMAIAYQLAQALDYLHKQQIVHGDIKSSNILLDERLGCKLCDFGSAKMGFSSTIQPTPSDSPFNRRNNNRFMMMGSPGYTDPQYLRTGLATKKNDVYSFGIVILELVTGIEAFCPSSGARLVKTAEPMLRDVEKVVEMVDPQLVRGGFQLEEAKAMAAMAAKCLSDSSSVRPSASDILTTMEKEITSLSFVLEKKNRV